jgi:hypothetical protein
VTAFLAYFEFSFAGPILALRVKEFNLPHVLYGIFCGLSCISYAVSSFALVSFLRRKFKDRAVILVSLFLSSQFQLLVGP